MLHATAETTVSNATSDAAWIQYRQDILDKSQEYRAQVEEAYLIQQAVLPRTERVRSAFAEFEVWNQPIHSLTGDFYWFYQKRKQAFIAVGDCTGHGVPGAMLSMLAVTTLHHILRDFSGMSAELILSEMNQRLRTLITQHQSGNMHRWGMDMAVAQVDHKRNRLVFASANRPVYLVRNGKLEVYRRQNMPIGGESMDEVRDYSRVEVEFAPGDSLYLFTDGVTDQISGLNGRKWGSTRLQAALSRLHKLPMAQQFRELRAMHRAWAAGRRTTDDILMLGIRG